VIASSTLEAGAIRSYSSGARKVAASGRAGLTTSTNGGNEKTAVIDSIAVITSGHRYRETRRNFRACKCLVAKFGPADVGVD
jgi:hypothetical protein